MCALLLRRQAPPGSKMLCAKSLCWHGTVLQENDANYETHKVWLKHRRQNQEDQGKAHVLPPCSQTLEDIIFFENTPGYNEDLLTAALGRSLRIVFVSL